MLLDLSINFFSVVAIKSINFIKFALSFACQYRMKCETLHELDQMLMNYVYRLVSPFSFCFEMLSVNNFLIEIKQVFSYLYTCFCIYMARYRFVVDQLYRPRHCFTYNRTFYDFRLNFSNYEI